MRAAGLSALLLLSYGVCNGQMQMQEELFPYAECPGAVQVGGLGAAEMIPMWWDNISTSNNNTVVCKMDGRAYFADACTAGYFDNRQYLALNLLGSTLSYTTDIHDTGCGCNAAMYLTGMRHNPLPSNCTDYYCDANAVCGVACAEIDIQESNMHAWHTTLHSKEDPQGFGMGFGGGGRNWTGPREWTADEYGPGASCIDTRQPFQVEVSFPVDERGNLISVTVMLLQPGTSCQLQLKVDKYNGMAEMSEALAAGMTPIVSYWKSRNMTWMDGEGPKKDGPCAVDTTDCAESVKFYNFNIRKMPTPTSTSTPRPHRGPAQAREDAEDASWGMTQAQHTGPKVPDFCRGYTVGCGWTANHSCPGQRPGRIGVAGNDGSVGYRCCCEAQLWKGESPEVSAAEPWQQCGGMKDGLLWWGATGCTEGYVCKKFSSSYAQCVKMDSNSLLVMKDMLFGTIGHFYRSHGMASVAPLCMMAALMAVFVMLTVQRVSQSFVGTLRGYAWVRNSHIELRFLANRDEEETADV